MYYHGFQKKFPASNTPWTHGDDQLVGLLFSKIITRTATNAQVKPPAQSSDMVDNMADEMAHNLFDLMLYINKDFYSC